MSSFDRSSAPENDKIIKFPGLANSSKTPGNKQGNSQGDGLAKPAKPSEQSANAAAPEGAPDMNEDRQKALGIVMSGMSFVIIGIKPTERGADFFTALAGNPDDLRQAHSSLPGVIDRLFARRGLDT